MVTNQTIIDACRLSLHHKEFINDYLQLVRGELSFDGVTEPRLTAKQVSRLIDTASLFSLNDSNEQYQKLAFKIAMFLFIKYRDSYPIITFATELILTRLGDLPAIKAITKNKNAIDLFSFYPKTEDIPSEDSLEIDSPLVYVKFPEIVNRKNSNTIKVQEGLTLVLTNFQEKIYRLLREGKSIAFSAPTSAGKSYIIYNYIGERVKNSENFSAVYIAPTKALIAEVEAEIKKAIYSLGIKPSEFGIYMSANVLNLEEVRATRKKVVVMTQERLQEMLSNNLDFRVDLLVLDEAQKVAEKTRGVIIEDSVQELIAKNIGIQKVFISPYVGNLKKYEKIFGTYGVIPEQTYRSPVAQNFLKVKFTDRKVDVSLIAYELKSALQEYFVPLTSIPLKSNTKHLTIEERLAYVASRMIQSEEPTLVYCSTRPSCRTTAGLIGEQLKKPELSNALTTAIQFLEEHVHKDYYLIDALRNGLGYHYGKLPQFVRYYVRDLFENGKINILCCTSTLLEGVNLPARNMVLYDPKLGRAHMDRLSLRNLAGRAGRLLMDYYGKVYCINQDEWKLKEDIFEDKPEEIESAAEKQLEVDAKALIKYLENQKALNIPVRIKVLATSLMIKQIKYGNSRFLEGFIERNPEIEPAHIEKIATTLVKNAREVTSIIDREIILRNRGIDPRLQVELLREMERYTDVSVPCPKNGSIDGDLLKLIFRRIYRILFQRTDERYSYHAALAAKWITQRPYSVLVDDKIRFSKKYQKEDEDDKTFHNRMIDDLDTDLEETLKFNYTKGLKLYVDLALEVAARKPHRTYEICQELPILLEAGAFDKKVLILLEVGFSRNYAIDIFKYVQLFDGDFSDNLSCVDWLSNNYIRLKDAIRDRIIRKELREVLEAYQMKLPDEADD